MDTLPRKCSCTSFDRPIANSLHQPNVQLSIVIHRHIVQAALEEAFHGHEDAYPAGSPEHKELIVSAHARHAVYGLPGLGA